MTLTPKKITIILVSIMSAALLMAAGYLIYRSIYSANINLYFAPKSANVKLGSGGGNFGDNYVKPGTYKVVISKSGFTTYTQEVTVKSGETKSIEAALDPTSLQTKDWYKNNTEDYTIAQTIGDRKADNQRAQFVRDFPIAKDLPIVGLFGSYRVDYGTSPTTKGKYAVFISYQSESTKAQAVRSIQSKGYDISKFEVVYRLVAPTSGSVTYMGISNLSDRGVSASVVDVVKAKLSEKYATTTGVDGRVTINFVGDTEHTMSDDHMTHTYITSYNVNGAASNTLKIVVQDFNNATISVGNEVIFQGAT